MLLLPAERGGLVLQIRRRLGGAAAATASAVAVLVDRIGRINPEAACTTCAASAIPLPRCILY